MGDPRTRTLAHLQHLLAAAAVGVTVSSCTSTSKEEIGPDPATNPESAQPPATVASGEPTTAPAESSAPGSPAIPIDTVATPQGPADAGADAGRKVVKPKPPPTGYRVVDPLPPPPDRRGKRDPLL